VIAIIAVAVWLATRTHHGSGGHRHATPPPHQTTGAIKLSSASSYNPDSLGANHAQDDSEAPNVITGANGGWSTQHYYGGVLGKAGVGVFVRTAGGAAAAKRLALVTDTPGFAVTVYGSNQQPNVNDFAASGWVKLGDNSAVDSTDNISLSSQGTGYRFYLVWITQLPPDAQSATINLIKLYG
jgi:hypothetical protein